MINPEDDIPGCYPNVYRTFMATQMLHHGGPSDLPLVIWGRHLPLTGQWVAPLETTPLGTGWVEIMEGFTSARLGGQCVLYPLGPTP